MDLTIYFGDKPIIITNTQPKINVATDFLVVHDTNAATLEKIIANMELPASTGAMIVASNVEEALNELRQHFVFIEAAGGLVISDKGNLLLIFRKGKWDLPKGKLDPGEDLEQCAVREMEEETGLEGVVIKQPLCRTYHTYHQYGQHVLKASHWYLMHAPEQEQLQPQTDEDIQEAIWVHPKDLDFYIDNAHRSVADVLNLAKPMLQY